MTVDAKGVIPYDRVPRAGAAHTGGQMSDEMRISVVAAPVREQVLNKLREAIFSRTFAPGQRLIERELCEATGVSRTSVREALRQLQAEGLVTVVPHRGPIVSRISADEAAELYQVRSVLEGLAVRLFTERATEEQLARLVETVDRIHAGSADGPAALLSAKDHFYEVLFEGAGNAMLIQVLESLRARVTHLRSTSLHRSGRPPETVQELRSILEAVTRRDPNAAWQAAVHHVQQAGQVAQQILLDEEMAARANT